MTNNPGYPQGGILDDWGPVQTRLALHPETKDLIIIDYSRPVKWLLLDEGAARLFLRALTNQLARLKLESLLVMSEAPLQRHETWADREDTTLETLMAYCRSVTTAPDRAVRDEAGELSGYWQTTEWIEGLLALCEEGDRDV